VASRFDPAPDSVLVPRFVQALQLIMRRQVHRTLILSCQSRVLQDLVNSDLTAAVWTGVVPVRKVTGTPEPTKYASEGPPPEHVRQL
jgi:hypothetical protein